MQNESSWAAELTDVSAFYGHLPALHGVSATFRRGALTGIVGGNGSGKSTLVNVLAGIHRPDHGTVQRAPGLRTGLVVQQSAVPDQLPLTTRDVVALGRWGRDSGRRSRRADRDVVQDCLAQMAISDLGDRRFGTLSGGQRQRALVAQGLARQADLLLLDEPTAALDEESRLRVLAALRAEADRGAAVVLVTHHREEVGDATTILHLDRGRCTVGRATAPPRSGPASSARTEAARRAGR